MVLEDDGMIGNLPPAAIVGRNGAIDRLCPPRFDSASWLAALVQHHGSKELEASRAHRRQIGNFAQGFSRLMVILAARPIAAAGAAVGAGGGAA
jgi:hypothetical protein